MKSLALLLSLLFSINISLASEDCIGQICIGDEVMDNLGWSGYVVDVDKTKNTLSVQMPIDDSIFDIPYSELGKRANCVDGFCEKGDAFDRDGLKVEVVAVYTNKMARIWTESLYEMSITHIKNLRLK